MTAPEPGTVRIAQAEGFGAYASGIGGVRDVLGGVGSHRHVVLPHPPAGAFPEADMTGPLADLQLANENAVTRLADFTTRADRGLAGLAFVAAYIGTRFPAADQLSAQRMEELVREAQDAAPPVPAELPGVDPTFQSPQQE